MNKFMYTFLAPLICATMLLFSCHNNKLEDGIPELKATVAAAAPKEETDNIRLKYKEAKDALKKNPEDLKQYLSLATLFILEGRITGDGSYYSNSALLMLNKVIDNPTSNNDQLFEAFSLKSAVLLNMHQFKDAQEMAKKAVVLNGYNSGIYGALVDANVELGLYDSAVANCDRMLSLRPDLRSYSRASYLRQIHGDNRGAIEAMKLSVEAGLPGAEQTEWARVTMGDLFMNIGSIDTAEILYKMSLVYRNNYPYAQMGMAKVAKARKQYDSAIVHIEKAIKLMSDPSFIAALADIYELKGEQVKAMTIRKDVLKGIKEGLDEEKENELKHNANRELAQAYLNTGDIQSAYKYAKADIEMRPNNIDANELMAWILFLKKDYAIAKIYAGKMLLKNTQNANSIYKAAAIYAAAGEVSKAAMLKKQALQLSPYIDTQVKMLGGNL